MRAAKASDEKPPNTTLHVRVKSHQHGAAAAILIESAWLMTRQMLCIAGPSCVCFPCQLCLSPLSTPKLDAVQQQDDNLFCI